MNIFVIVQRSGSSWAKKGAAPAPQPCITGRYQPGTAAHMTMNWTGSEET